MENKLPPEAINDAFGKAFAQRYIPIRIKPDKRQDNFVRPRMSLRSIYVDAICSIRKLIGKVTQSPSLSFSRNLTASYTQTRKSELFASSLRVRFSCGANRPTSLADFWNSDLSLDLTVQLTIYLQRLAPCCEPPRVFLDVISPLLTRS